MKKMNWKKSLTLTASAALALALLAGCGAQPAEQVSSENGAVGTVLLSVNPEIEVPVPPHGYRRPHPVRTRRSHRRILPPASVRYF